MFWNSRGLDIRTSTMSHLYTYMFLQNDIEIPMFRFPTFEESRETIEEKSWRSIWFHSSIVYCVCETQSRTRLRNKEIVTVTNVISASKERERERERKDTKQNKRSSRNTDRWFLCFLGKKKHLKEFKNSGASASESFSVASFAFVSVSIDTHLATRGWRNPAIYHWHDSAARQWRRRKTARSAKRR